MWAQKHEPCASLTSNGPRCRSAGQARGQPPPALQPRCCYQNCKQPGHTAVSVQGWGWGQVCALQPELGTSNHPRASLGPRTGIPLSSPSPGCISKFAWDGQTPAPVLSITAPLRQPHGGQGCGVGSGDIPGPWLSGWLRGVSEQLCHGGCSIGVRRVLSACRERTAASNRRITHNNSIRLILKSSRKLKGLWIYSVPAALWKPRITQR